MKVITLDVKSKIFAQYFGSEYIYKNEFGSFKGTIEFGHNTKSHIENKNSRILLKKIINISDEDAIEAIQMNLDVKYKKVEINLKDNHSIYFTYKTIRGDWNSRNLIYSELIFNVYQFLQSKGYALPYMDYSVEDLVELGVYKLK